MVALAAVAILRVVGRDDRAPALAFAAGLLLWHVAFWLKFATPTGLGAFVAKGSECCGASPGDVFEIGDSRPDCELTDAVRPVFLPLFLTLPVVGSGLAARAILVRRWPR